ncbi:MAG: ChbG/HpnK family deacetylase [Myxococcales bacterium]|nr:ChbG/HpnK family deacetylase [Myxococcales bacterium]
MGERHLYFTADDLGGSPELDRGIARTVERGVVRSVSLLVDGPTSVSAARWAADTDVAVGLHLVAAPAPPLVAARGIAVSALGAVWHARTLTSAFTAQLDRFLALVGRAPDFLNCHQHLHILPGVLDALVALATQSGVKRLRSSVELGALELPRLGQKGSVRRALWPVVSRVAARQSERLRQRGFRMPEGIVGGRDSGVLSLGRLDVLVPALAGHRAVEVVVHPRFDSIERLALCAPVLPELLDAHGFTPGDWRDV